MGGAPESANRPSNGSNANRRTRRGGFRGERVFLDQRMRHMLRKLLSSPSPRRRRTWRRRETMADCDDQAPPPKIASMAAEPGSLRMPGDNSAAIKSSG